jgi:hypothetical protein
MVGRNQTRKTSVAMRDVQECKRICIRLGRMGNWRSWYRAFDLPYCAPPITQPGNCRHPIQENVCIVHLTIALSGAAPYTPQTLACKP